MKKLLTSAAFALLLASPAFADTEIIVTGATAFRKAAQEAILAKYSAGVKYAYNGANLGASGQAYFTGSFPGFSGTTVIRTTFTGSVEGVRDVTLGNTITCLDPATNVATTSGASGITSPTVLRVPNYTFSDCATVSTPYDGSSLGGGPCGVIVFVPVANEGSPARLNNVTKQELASIAQRGRLPLSMFTGLSTDTNQVVFYTGRNDFSGTRTIQLAEAGYGFINPVTQYFATQDATPQTTELRVWPVTLTTDPTFGATMSTVWNTGVNGNGGYASGGNIQAVLDDPIAAPGTLIIRNAAGTNVTASQAGTGGNHLISILGTSDAATAIAGGARLLSWNGVTFTPSTTTFPVAEIAKVTKGQYSLWSFENFFYDSVDVSADEKTNFYDVIFSQLQASIEATGAGIAFDSMGTTSRGEDGGPITP